MRIDNLNIHVIRPVNTAQDLPWGAQSFRRKYSRLRTEFFTPINKGILETRRRAVAEYYVLVGGPF